MMIFFRLKNIFETFCGRKHYLENLRGLKLERYHLQRKIDETEKEIKKIENEFEKDGGCPCCFLAEQGGTGSPFDLMEKKNERRIERLKMINDKLRRFQG